MIPRFKPALSLDEIRNVFLFRNNLVEKFEKKFAYKFKSKQAVSFSYGRTALFAFLKANNISDSEIIIPAYTCSVVAHAITESGNLPIFVDISLLNFNMKLDLLHHKINKNTKAIIATHLFGYALDMEKLLEIVSEYEFKYNHKIWVIEDCAHSYGASIKNKIVGSYGDAALYGLNISKIITSVNGGMLTFNDPKLANKIIKWRNKNLKKATNIKSLKRRIYLILTYLAFNKVFYRLVYFLQYKTNLLKQITDKYHLDDKIHFPPDAFELMTNFEASIGLSQIKKYDGLVKNRRENALIFDNYFSKIKPKDWILPPIIDGSTYSHYVVRVKKRSIVKKLFEEKGFELGEIIQYSIPETNSYKMEKYNFNNSKKASQTTINLPLHLSKNEMNKLVKKVPLGRVKTLLILGNDKISAKVLRNLKVDNDCVIMIDKTNNLKRIFKLIIKSRISINFVLKCWLNELRRNRISYNQNITNLFSNFELENFIHSRHVEKIVLFKAGLIVNKTIINLGVPIYNIHCARIDGFGGLGAIDKALKKGQYKQCATLHKVTENIDNGEVLAEEPYLLNPKYSFFKNENIAYKAGEIILNKLISGSLLFQKIK